MTKGNAGKSAHTIENDDEPTNCEMEEDSVQTIDDINASSQYVSKVAIDLLEAHLGPDGPETDFDEYALFETDYERYLYDRKRFEGIGKANKLAVKRVYYKKSKSTGLKAPRKYKFSEKQIFPDSKTKTVISFDAKGRLWYTHTIEYDDADGNIIPVPICERAAYHHWLRCALFGYEGLNGQYAFPHHRRRGLGNCDVTSFNNMQRYWGKDRPNYAPVMFEYECQRSQNIARNPGDMYVGEQLVIDYWLSPVRAFREIPLVISSAYEGAFIEPSLRIRPEMGYRDIVARMPPFVQVRKNLHVRNPLKNTRLRPAFDQNVLSNRARRFRELAGGISWRPEPSSAALKQYLDNCASQAGRFDNSTRNCTDLTVEEAKGLRLLMAGTAPYKAKKSSTDKGKQKYVKMIEDGRNSLKRANVESTRSSESAISSRQDLLDFDETERFIYLKHGPGFIVTYTREQAAADKLVDLTDPRHHFPENMQEVEAIQRALEPTAGALKEAIKISPDTNHRTSYIHQYSQMQAQLKWAWLGGPNTLPTLWRRARWNGSVFDYKYGEYGRAIEPEDLDGTRKEYGVKRSRLSRQDAAQT